jgi:hypothetical protein
VSGFRSRAQQERLYALYLSGRGNLAARPASSKHERGLAIDHAPRSTPSMRATAREFRLHYSARGEPWHVEPFGQGGILNPFMQSLDKGGWLQPGGICRSTAPVGRTRPASWGRGAVPAPISFRPEVNINAPSYGVDDLRREMSRAFEKHD